MKRLLSLWAVVFIAAATARLEAADTPAMAAWRAPMTRVFFDAGGQRLAALGSRSLTAFSKIGEHIPRIIAAGQQPFLFERLAAALAASGHTPGAFGALPLDAKIMVFHEAALAAETAADRDAAALIESANVTEESAAAIAARAGNLSIHDDAFLGDAVKARLREVLSRANRLVRAREELLAEFKRELPRKIHDGHFNASNVLLQTPKGWIVADQSPLPGHAAVSEALRERLDNAVRAPAGPWTTAMLDEIAEILKRSDVESALNAEGVSRAAFEQKVAAARRHAAGLTAAEVRSAYEAFARHENGGALPGVAQITAMLEHADQASEFSGYLPLTDRIASTLLKGSPAAGLPAWARLHEIRLLAKNRHHRLALRGFIALAISLVVSVALSAAQALMIPAVVIGLGFAIVLSLLTFAKGVHDRDQLGLFRDAGGLAESRLESFARRLSAGGPHKT